MPEPTPPSAGSEASAVPRAVEDLIRGLQLRPHPEGGHYREVFRSGRVVATSGGAERAALTSIYFLLGPGEHSRWHVVASDEAWHFHSGDPLELVCFDPEARRLERVVLGPPAQDTRPIHVVPAGHWQAARSTGPYSLVGCTVGPGFEFEDFSFVRDVPGHARVFEEVLGEYRELL